jgi:hypothetical protein
MAAGGGAEENSYCKNVNIVLVFTQMKILKQQE